MTTLEFALIQKLTEAASRLGTEYPTVDLTFSAFEIDLLLKMVNAGAAIRELTSHE